MLSAPEFAQIAAPFLAVVAAGASWASVALSRRQLDAALHPRLEGYWEELGLGGVRLTVENIGAGLARAPRLLAFVGGKEARGWVLRTGPLRPGHIAELVVDLPQQGEGLVGKGVLLCLDSSDNLHIWSWDGRHRLVRREWGQPRPRMNLDKALESMYPGESSALSERIEIEPAETSRQVV